MMSIKSFSTRFRVAIAALLTSTALFAVSMPAHAQRAMEDLGRGVGGRALEQHSSLRELATARTRSR
jgi:hypothetical protein